MKGSPDFPGRSRDGEELVRELGYLRSISERNAAKILSLDTKSIAIRHELEQKRRGFALLAELAVTLGRGSDYDSVFVSVSRRLNAALNMQRTVVLLPDGDGMFKPSVMQGYPADEERTIGARRIKLADELCDPARPVLITGEDPEDRLRDLREALALPYLISSPVFLQNDIAAILITGRLAEQPPFLTRLGRLDVETVQTLSSYLAAVLAGQRMVEAEERTRIMLDATPMCCSFWNRDFRVIDCNEEVVRMFGLSHKHEFLDRFFDLCPEFQPDGNRSAAAHERVMAIAFETGYSRFEWQHQNLMGEPIPTEVTLVRVKRWDGYIVLGYTRDLREYKAMLAEVRKTETELRAARDLAERNARAKSEFLANMSHEIRTPMNAILGMTHILSGTELTSKQRDYVDKAAHSANLLLRIINDILDFSKIDAGRMVMESVEFSMRSLTCRVCDMVMGQAESKSLSLESYVAPDVPDSLIGDPLRLEQVLLNIVNNAVKFTSEGGVNVRVSVAPDGANLLFEVIDTGIGMSEEQISRLFSPFTQADTSTTRKYGGTGLGLAISKSLVELMGGHIWCESSPGAGSKFFFTANLTLPEEKKPSRAYGDSEASPEPEPSPGPSCTSTDLEQLRGMRVLLAEDNDINQMIASELLTRVGVDVTTADNGLEALDALTEASFDVVLMDIQMPEMDGLTATARIRADPAYSGLPIIAMTAHAMEGDREISIGGGMNDHLTKPIDPGLLYAALMKWDPRRAR
ncbi:MAG: response regulator [Synergistaceae bacterium]|jgi:signal transduction histidine kinase/ActR/RegA family two-component response regulator|nr:response regulator [Synergistaceae bacterium]